jgi:hypothetical protein
MSISRARYRLCLALGLLVLPVTDATQAHAGGWGKGPSFGGYHPLSTPIPAKPLDGLKDAAKDTARAADVNAKGASKIVSDAGHALDVNAKGAGKIATDVWVAVKRPFVETAKFLRDPLAGLRQKVSDFLTKAKDAATSLAWKAALWLGIGFAAVIALSIALATGVAALILRHWLRKERYTERYSRESR